MKVDYRPSRRFAEYVRKIACDEWECGGRSGNDKAILRHRKTGQTVAYNLHDGGNDWNGPRNFAAAVQRICGCQLIEPRGRKRSRKNFTAAHDQLTTADRRRLSEFEAKVEQRDEQRVAEMRRAAAAQRAAEDDRRRREIENLMRPGR